MIGRVSVGFGEPTAAIPPTEILLWTVTKNVRRARAVVRVYPHGRELRVSVEDTLMWSRLYRDHEDSRELGQMAAGTLADFERVGWRRVEDAQVAPQA
jgi:hypothetical protein